MLRVLIEIDIVEEGNFEEDGQNGQNGQNGQDGQDRKNQGN